MENENKRLCWIERETRKTYPNRKDMKIEMGTNKFFKALERGKVFAIDRETYEALKEFFES